MATLARCSSPVAIIKKTVLAYVCERCDHEWIPRNETALPKVCPFCKNPNWNKPRVNPKKKRTTRKRGPKN